MGKSLLDIFTFSKKTDRAKLREHFVEGAAILGSQHLWRIETQSLNKGTFCLENMKKQVNKGSADRKCPC